MSASGHNPNGDFRPEADHSQWRSLSSMATSRVREYLRRMKPIPLKVRDRLLFGAAMAGTALVWAVAPNVRLASLGFLASGAIILAAAGYAWWKRDA